jgi:Spy/CpxP family protein refolding chaperone
MKTRLALIGVSSLLTLGLAAAPTIARADTATDEDVSTTSAAFHKAGHVFKQALEDVELRPEQMDAVDKLESDGEARHADTKAAKRELMMAVADQVEKGKLDECALQPQIEKVAAAAAKARPGDRAAFEQLHDILDKDQRAKFVDALQKHWKEHKKDAASMADKMATELKLTDDQKGKLEEILSALKTIREAEPGHAAHRERWTKIMEAFKGDTFKLDDIAPMGDVAAHTDRRIEHHLWAAEAILPILNKDQRELAAQKMRDKAQGHTETDGAEETYGTEESDED